MESSEAGLVMASCPACAAQIVPGEKFCAACGAAITAPGPALGTGVVVQDLPPVYARPDGAAAVSKARKWLVWVSIITVVTGLVFYVIQSGEVEKQITEARRATAGIDPAELDARFQQAVGMTFDQAIEHDRGTVRLLLVVNLGLAALYLVLWWWAKRKPLPATLIALLVFVTVMVVSAVFEPSTIYQGILVKIFFTLALVRAVTAAAEERKLAALAR